MKIRRLLILLVTISLTAAIGNLIQLDGRDSIYSDKYPAVVCPDIGGGAVVQVSLTNSNKLVRSLSRKTAQLVPAKSTRITSSSGSILVEGEGINSAAWISKTGIWAGGVICLAPQAEQYFVGASGDVSSKSQLVLANSGLSSSTIDITIYSDSNASFKKTVTVGKNKTLNISMVSLAPGAKSIALKVAPRTGRTSAYLVDERGKGLKALGGDLVNSQSQLKKTIYIPAISHTFSLEKTHLLRILNPNGVGANFSAELISADGRYVPIGMDNRNIPPDRVIDIPFDVDSKNSAFGLKITSDQPIAASTYSRVLAKGKTDFVWSSAVEPGQSGTWAITALDPQLIITGGAIKVSIKVIMPGGKKIDKKLTGTEILAYRIPTGALGLQINSISKDCAAALIVNSQSGTGYLPLVNGSLLTRSTVPTANIGVLNP